MKILQYPHPALRRVAKPLTAISPRVLAYAEEMFRLMYEARGIGLAATQVGLPYQLLVLNLTADPAQTGQEHVYINPVLIDRKGSIEDEEGCLSFPGLYQKIRRAKSIQVQAYDLKGQLVEINVSELASRALQHEIDHLHGVVFIDKMGPIAKLASRNALRELELTYRKAQERGEIPPDTEIHKMLDDLEAQA